MKIWDKMAIAHIKDGKFYLDEFEDRDTANAKFKELNAAGLPICTKKGTDSIRFWNSDEFDWVPVLAKSNRCFWEHSIGYEILSCIWEWTVFTLEVNHEDDDEYSQTTEILKIPCRGQYLFLAERHCSVAPDFGDTLLRYPEKYISWDFLDEDDEVTASFAKPEY